MTTGWFTYALLEMKQRFRIAGPISSNIDHALAEYHLQVRDGFYLFWGKHKCDVSFLVCINRSWSTVLIRNLAVAGSLWSMVVWKLRGRFVIFYIFCGIKYEFLSDLWCVEVWSTSLRALQDYSSDWMHNSSWRPQILQRSQGWTAPCNCFLQIDVREQAAVGEQEGKRQEL